MHFTILLMKTLLYVFHMLERHMYEMVKLICVYQVLSMFLLLTIICFVDFGHSVIHLVSQFISVMISCIFIFLWTWMFSVDVINC